MELQGNKLKKLIASEGKVLVRKDWVQEYDEENNPIPRDKSNNRDRIRNPWAYS